mmetsp:Transcript_26436/g.49402  ORF Transcript_26436/g.49402 Transcript_26436/m.49402 type:complete len:501 (-) Transcript_26436:180-1682(-)
MSTAMRDSVDRSDNHLIKEEKTSKLAEITIAEDSKVDQSSPYETSPRYWFLFIFWITAVYGVSLVVTVSFFYHPMNAAYLILVCLGIVNVSAVCNIVIAFKTRLSELEMIGTQTETIWWGVGVSIIMLTTAFLFVVIDALDQPVSDGWLFAEALISFGASVLGFHMSIEHCLKENNSRLSSGSVNNRDPPSKWRYSYGLYWSLIVYQAAWILQFVFLFWITALVINATRSGENEIIAYLIFHFSSLGSSTFLMFCSERMKDLDEAIEKTIAKQSGVLFQQLNRSPSSSRKRKWWVPFSRFACALLWNLLRRTLYINVTSVSSFITLSIIAGIFDTTWGVGCVFQTWMDGEKKLGKMLPMVIGCALPRLETEQDARAVQSERYESHILRLFTNTFTLILILPLYGMTHEYARDTFPTMSGKLSGISSNSLMNCFFILFFVEVSEFAIAEALFYFFEPRFFLRCFKQLQVIIRGHEINFLIISSHVITVSLVHLAQLSVAQG